MGLEIRHGRRDVLRAIAAAGLLGQGMARADDAKNGRSCRSKSWT